MNLSPVLSTILPFSNLPIRIFGPCRSARTPTAWPAERANERVNSAYSICSSRVPWEKLILTTSTPAFIMRSRTLGSRHAGPSVATIFVLRIIWMGLAKLRLLGADNQRPRCSSISTAGSFFPSRNSRNAPPAVEIYDTLS